MLFFVIAVTPVPNFNYHSSISFLSEPDLNRSMEDWKGTMVGSAPASGGLSQMLASCRYQGSSA